MKGLSAMDSSNAAFETTLAGPQAPPPVYQIDPSQHLQNLPSKARFCLQLLWWTLFYSSVAAILFHIHYAYSYLQPITFESILKLKATQPNKASILLFEQWLPGLGVLRNALVALCGLTLGLFLRHHANQRHWAVYLISATCLGFGAHECIIWVYHLDPHIMPRMAFYRLLFLVPTALSIFISIYAVLVFPDGRAYPKPARILTPVILGYACLYAYYVFFMYRGLNFHLSTFEIPILLTIVICQIARYHQQASTLQKQQLRWFIAGAWIVIVANIAYALLKLPVQSSNHEGMLLFFVTLRHLILFLSYTLPMLFLVFAIMKTRLWGVDLILHRFLVYGTLFAILAAIASVILFGFHTLWIMWQGSKHIALPIAIAATINALLFRPLLRLLRHFVDRYLYGIVVDYKAMDLRARQIALQTALAPNEHVQYNSVGPYSGLQLIGKGGMGEVYRAISPNGNTVAIKILPNSSRNNAEALQRFQREVEAIQQLKHPSIIPLLDAGERQGQHYMVMPYINRGNLKELIQQRPALPQVLPLLNDVASALDYAHAQGIIHRDIKPSNILLQDADPEKSNPRQRAILADFGIARIQSMASITEPHQTGNMLGTLAYISPEQIQGKKHIDGRADLYSFAVMTYHILTGRLPFQHKDPLTMIIAHLMHEPPDPRHYNPSISDRIAQTILRGLAKDPIDRPRDLKTFVQNLTPI